MFQKKGGFKFCVYTNFFCMISELKYYFSLKKRRVPILSLIDLCLRNIKAGLCPSEKKHTK